MPATAVTSTTVTVAYDPAIKTIDIEVILSLNALGVQFEVAPVTVPRGTWTLTWDLVVTTAGLKATFNGAGIILPPAPSPLPSLPPLLALPQDVTVVSGPMSLGAGRSTAKLKNDGIGVAAFKYYLVVDSLVSSGGFFEEKKTVYHDPTIAVVEEPMG
jgi:hypothetical protein